MVEENPKMPPAKAAHVNMMIDTIIANLPADGLRQVLRGILGGDQTLTSNMVNLAATYLDNTRPTDGQPLFVSEHGSHRPTPAFFALEKRYRCLMGCGRGFESIGEITNVVKQVQGLEWGDKTPELEQFLDVLAFVDGDIVQAATAIQKELLTSSGVRNISSSESEKISSLLEALNSCSEKAARRQQEFPFSRGLVRLDKLVGRPSRGSSQTSGVFPDPKKPSPSRTKLESVKLGSVEVPRVFMGLWQFSSPSWGTASRSKIERHFRKHVDAGLVAYDMADHYGDAEITFGHFRSAQPDSKDIYCATKWAVFGSVKISAAVVDANIKERLTAIDSSRVELLQFHWQDYNDPQYIEACKLIAAHPGVQSLGLCNFDTERVVEIANAGIPVVSNQVQFSLIDLRPTFAMGEVCKEHNIKLLTYGSLCGGFLADKWIKKSTPNLFDEDMTPSHRKYLEMILIWGGWALFQELLQVLERVGNQYGVSVSCVAIRWVLDHEYVGAVIIGARMGISEHVEENLPVFSCHLSQEDKEAIGEVLKKSRAIDVFQAMGDCGSEYR